MIPAAPPTLDPLDASTVHRLAPGDLLGVFNRAGVLAPADVHVAARLARLGGDPDVVVSLAVALAVRAPRVGHVSVDLRTVRTVAATDAGEDVDVDGLPWPDADGWLAAVAASPLVAVGDDADDRPVRLIGSALYLDRYWRDELVVADDVSERAAADPPSVDGAVLRAGLARLFTDGKGEQARAAATAATRRFSVVAGGPGTGKTTTVGRLLALLHEQADAAGERPPLVALAAPTGKAAARLEEAVRAEATHVPVTDSVRQRLLETTGSTLHRLLGSRPNSGRFRHHRGLRLPHDVIVVDEASMVSLALMARLVEAVRPDARLVLVGDPEQLVSVEAGAVLADIVGPAMDPQGGPEPADAASGPSLAEEPAGAAGVASGISAGPAGARLAASIALLRANHRFAGALADLAAAVRAGDAERTVEVLGAGDPAVSWWPQDPAADPELIRPAVAGWAGELLDVARAGDGQAALAHLGGHRILCAHRRGPDGTVTWNERIERWIVDDRPELAGLGPWYPGRPVLVTANDYGLRLFNGDTGVTVTSGASGQPSSAAVVAFDGGAGRNRALRPSRLADVETVWAMTVHKSQGSEFDRVTLLLPPAGSRLLTRQLLYTAVTRARAALVVAGTEEAVRVAVGRPIARASGLTERLWYDDPA